MRFNRKSPWPLWALVISSVIVACTQAASGANANPPKALLGLLERWKTLPK